MSKSIERSYNLDNCNVNSTITNMVLLNATESCLTLSMPQSLTSHLTMPQSLTSHLAYFQLPNVSLEDACPIKWTGTFAVIQSFYSLGYWLKAMKLVVQPRWDVWLTADPITILNSRVNGTTDPFQMQGHRPIQWLAFQNVNKLYRNSLPTGLISRHSPCIQTQLIMEIVLLLEPHPCLLYARR